MSRHAWGLPARLVTSLALVFCFSECSIRNAGRSLGHSAAVAGLAYLRSDTGRAAVSAFAESSAHAVAVAFQDRLQPTLDSAVQALLTRGRADLRGAEESLVAVIGGPLSDAMSRLVRTNLRVAGVEARSQLDLTVGRVASDLERDLTPALQRSIVAATQSFGTQLAASVRTELRVAAESALAAAVRAGVESGSKTAQRSPVWQAVLWIGGGLIAALLLVAAAWFYRQHRKSVMALDAVAGAVQRSGTPELKAQIKDRAADRNVDEWLHGYLVKRRYLT